MRIALIGFYSFGNFGDDLMAVLFGTAINQRGDAVRVLGLADDEARTWQMESCSTVDALLDDVDALVLGGGGLFVRDPRDGDDTLIRVPPGSRMYQYDESLARTAAICAARGIPMALISVGGGGFRHHPRPAIAELVRVASLITVRNEADLAIADFTRASVTYFPDVVLRTAATFERPRVGPGRRRIGIDLHLASAERCAELDAILGAVTASRADIDVVEFDPERADRWPSAPCRNKRLGSSSSLYRFGNLRRDLDFLASLDLVLSTRLHVGVVALSFGVPFFSISGQPKTLTFMQSAGLAGWCFGSSSDNQRLCSLLGADTWELGSAQCRLQHMTDASRGHLDSLVAWLDARRGDQSTGTIGSAGLSSPTRRSDSPR